MLKQLIHHKGFYNPIPLMSHTRDCWLAKYADRTEIKIPLHNEKIATKPVVIYDKDTITIIFSENAMGNEVSLKEVDGSEQCL
jgi:hypothetical protein